MGTCRVHDFKPGDLVTYFKPVPSQTERYIAQVIKTYPHTEFVRIRFWVDGEPKDIRVMADNLEPRRDSLKGLH
jgi:hypothetical protein